MSRTLAHILCIVVAGSCLSASAQARSLTRNMSCQEAKNVIDKQGFAVLDTDKFIYDRYVKDERFCPPRQATEPAWVPTKDNPQCFIGYTCIEPDSDIWFR
ncbi:hypothetical protein WJT86_04085 [Microvirga sp. W0021]|uniref:Uncharacterized protein n=1 Tax=Hohaiivirga grylli TaxID=3133970 RepID=A0ABV0BGZ6_9HYPH